jgi:ribosomal protein L10
MDKAQSVDFMSIKSISANFSKDMRDKINEKGYNFQINQNPEDEEVK